MLSLARALALVACCLPFAVPSAAHADLSLSHVEAKAVPVGGDGDDVVSPGDAIQLTERIRTAGELTDATGRLFTPTPGVNLEADTAAFTSAPAGGESFNFRPFEASLASNLSCGANLSFTTVVAADGDQDSVSFLVPTGARGPSRAYDAVGDALADSGTTNVPLNLPGVDRVKAMEVRIGSLRHPRLADLRVSLVAPDGTVRVLAEAGTLTGARMTDTVFADGELPAAGAFAPYTGRFAPRDALAGLEGRSLNGTWMLRIVDTVADGRTGTLGAWGLDASKAYCAGIPKAAFSAVPQPALPGDTVEFDASNSTDSGGAIVSYEWDLDGDGQYDDGTEPQASWTYPVKTSVLVRLRVTDSDGLVDVEEQRLPVTSRPVARLEATPTDPLSGDTVRLDAGRSRDPDGTITRYQWAIEQTDVPERDTQGVSYLDVTFNRPGTHTVKVWVADEDGAEASAELEVVVRNRPPVAAVAAPALPLEGRPTTLSAAASSDPDGSVTAYEWDLDGDGTFETGPFAESTVEHTFASAGRKTVRVRVTDDAGETATASRAFTVTRPPAVVLAATPNPVSLRDDVALDASESSDPDAAGPLTFEWDVENDGTFAAPSAPTLTAAWPTAGTRTVNVRVTDASGATTVGSVDVVVRNILPVATLRATPSAPKAEEATRLSAVASDADGSIVRYQWDLDGDQSYELDTGLTPSASTSFANPGNVTVGVRVTDDDGGTGTHAITLRVAEPDEGPSEPADPDPDPGPGDPPGDGSDVPAPGDGAQPPAPAADGGAPGPPGPPAGVQDPGDPAGPAPAFAASLGAAATQSAGSVRARGVLLSCRSEVAVSCAVRIRVGKRAAKRLKLGRKAVTIAKRALSVPEDGVVRTRLKLSRKARRAVRRTGRATLRIRAVARAADGREVALARTVRLRP